jgi:hypothetical protein
MKLTQFAVDDGPHNSDGLLLHGWDSLYREQYNALGQRNLAAIERIVTSKYQRGPAFNRQYPFVDVLLSDITESGETLDASEFARAAGAVASKA